MVMQQLLANQEKAEANRKADCEALEEIEDANQERINVKLREMREEIKSGQAEMKSQ
jgi:hypothetical protein